MANIKIQRAKVFLSLAFILSWMMGNSQSFNFDIPEESQPHYEVYQYDAENKTNIKKQIRLKVDRPSFNQKADTLNIYHYNKKGQITKQISFRENKQKFISNYTYKNGLLISQKYKDLSGVNKGSVHTYTYDQKGNKTTTCSVDYRKGDTTMVSIKKWTYDQHNNLIKKMLHMGNKREGIFKRFSQKAEFEYDNNNHLILHRHTNPGVQSTPVSKYFYSNNNLDSIKRFYQTDTSESAYDYCKYKYNAAGQLIFKETVSKISRNNEPFPMSYHTYEYNKNGELERATYFSNQDTCVSVKYQFVNGLLTCIDAYNFEPKRSSKIYFFYPNSTFHAKEEFIRDEKGYLIETKKYFDGVLNEVIYKQNEFYTE